MEEQEKQQTLSQLYALRAGLSAISQEKDRCGEIVSKYNKDIADIDKEEADGRRKIDNINSRKDILIRNEGMQSAHIKRVKAAQEKREELINQANNILRKEQKGLTMLLVFDICILIAFIVSLAVHITVDTPGSLAVTIVFGIFTGLFIVVAFIPGVRDIIGSYVTSLIFIVPILIYEKTNKNKEDFDYSDRIDSRFNWWNIWLRYKIVKRLKNVIANLKVKSWQWIEQCPDAKELFIGWDNAKKILQELRVKPAANQVPANTGNDEIRIAEENNAAYRSEMKELDIALDEARAYKYKLDDKTEEGRKAAAAQAKQELILAKTNSESIYTALQENFSAVLDERDWKYVDMFIYMYETGRAESKKEALQLIDQYEQNRSITEAVCRAGQEVKLSIESGLSRLQNSMVECFRGISAQLSTMHSETMLKMDRMVGRLDDINAGISAVGVGLGAVSAGLASTAQAIELNNALQAKANVSAQQLLDDVHYMRTLDENEEIRRRNGL